MRENLTSRLVKSALAGALGSRIVALRQERRWSQRALGARLGIDTSKLNRYENGEHLPPHLTLLQIADAFGISLDVLMGRERAEAPPGEGRPHFAPRERLAPRDARLDRLFGEIAALEKEYRDVAASVLEGVLRLLRYVRDPETSRTEVESR